MHLETENSACGHSSALSLDSHFAFQFGSYQGLPSSLFQSFPPLPSSLCLPTRCLSSPPPCRSPAPCSVPCSSEGACPFFLHLAGKRIQRQIAPPSKCALYPGGGTGVRSKVLNFLEQEKVINFPPPCVALDSRISSLYLPSLHF